MRLLFKGYCSKLDLVKKAIYEAEKVLDIEVYKGNIIQGRQ